MIATQSVENSAPCLGQLGSRRQFSFSAPDIGFGTILSTWKYRDSTCAYSDQMSLVRLTRNPRVLQNLLAQRQKRKHVSIRFFQSKRFQHTLSTSTADDATFTDQDLSETQTDDDPEELIVQKAAYATSLVVSESFESKYTIGRKLGEGAFATVMAGTHHDTGKTYAVKMVDTSSLGHNELKALHTEMGIMAQLQHDHIVGLHEIYKVEPNFYFMVMEYVHGGELLDRLVQKEYYSEKEARDATLALFDAIAYCHRRGIAHRDLKPENLLLVGNGDDANIKICDFGFAKKCTTQGLVTLCGTPSYVAPEIVTCAEGSSGPYDMRCDNWSLGVICYILLSGYSPFGDGSDERTLYRLIKAGLFEFHAEYWAPVSDEAKDFISSLLQVHPDARMTAKQALDHSWLTADEGTLTQQDLRVCQQELKRFNVKHKFRAAVNTLIAAQRLVRAWGLDVFLVDHDDDDSLDEREEEKMEERLCIPPLPVMEEEEDGMWEEETKED